MLGQLSNNCFYLLQWCMHLKVGRQEMISEKYHNSCNNKIWVCCCTDVFICQGQKYKKEQTVTGCEYRSNMSLNQNTVHPLDKCQKPPKFNNSNSQCIIMLCFALLYQSGDVRKLEFTSTSVDLWPLTSDLCCDSHMMMLLLVKTHNIAI